MALEHVEIDAPYMAIDIGLVEWLSSHCFEAF